MWGAAAAAVFAAGSGPELARAVCGYAGVQCEMVPMTVLDDRIASLQNGTVDVLFAVGGRQGRKRVAEPHARLPARVQPPFPPRSTRVQSLAVTPERAELVDYLRPFYDASDLSLVALDSQADKLAADGTFAGLAGQRLCVVVSTGERGSRGRCV